MATVNSTILKLPIGLCLLMLGVGVFTGCGKQVVTREEFERVNVGMSYDDVVYVVGQEGNKLSTQAVGSVTSLDGNSMVCTWRNSDGSRMSAIFENNRLVSKSEHRLN